MLTWGCLTSVHRSLPTGPDVDRLESSTSIREVCANALVNRASKSLCVTIEPEESSADVSIWTRQSLQLLTVNAECLAIASNSPEVRLAEAKLFNFLMATLGD